MQTVDAREDCRRSKDRIRRILIWMIVAQEEEAGKQLELSSEDLGGAPRDCY